MNRSKKRREAQRGRELGGELNNEEDEDDDSGGLIGSGGGSGLMRMLPPRNPAPMASILSSLMGHQQHHNHHGHNHHNSNNKRKSFPPAKNFRALPQAALNSLMGSYLRRLVKAENGIFRRSLERETGEIPAIWSAKIYGRDLVSWRYSHRAFWASPTTRHLYSDRMFGNRGSLTRLMVLAMTVDEKQ